MTRTLFTLPLLGAALFAAPGNAASYYVFTNSGGQAHIRANWDPPTPPLAEWFPGDTGLVTNGVTLLLNGNPYPSQGNTLGVGSTLQINPGGTVSIVNHGSKALYNDFQLNGGTLAFPPSMGWSINGEFHITAASTLAANACGDAFMRTRLSGSGNLIITSSHPGGANLDNTLRFFNPCPEFTGNIILRGPVYLQRHNALGPGPLFIEPNGALHLGVNFHNPVVLRGGIIRSIGGNYPGLTLSGPITLEADSHLDAAGAGNNPLNITGDIAGPHTLILAADLPPPTGRPGLAGAVRFQGNNANWKGNLIQHNPAGLVRFYGESSLPGGALIAPNGMRLRLLQNTPGFTLSNNLQGPFTISITATNGNQDGPEVPSNHCLILANNTLNGALTLHCRLLLSNATLRLKAGRDLLDLRGIGATPEAPNVVLHNTVLDLTCDDLPVAPVILLQNNGPIPVSGVFINAQGVPLPEGATIPLGNHRATLTYTHTVNNNPTSIALINPAPNP